MHGCFVPSCVEIGLVDLKKKIFNLKMFFRYFIITSPWEGRVPSFEQTSIPFTQGYFVPSLFEIGPVVLVKKVLKFRLYIFAISLLEKAYSLR